MQQYREQHKSGKDTFFLATACGSEQYTSVALSTADLCRISCSNVAGLFLFTNVLKGYPNRFGEM